MAFISKIKIGEVVYDLKDAALLARINTLVGDHTGTAVLGDVAWMNKVTAITETGEEIPTEGAVRNYVQNAVADLAGAMHYVGKYDSLDALKAAITTPADGDVALIGTKEYIYGNAATGKDWVELGDEGIYLTIATAEADYVKKTTTIAGIDLADNITADELKTALGIANLGALAFVDTAAGTVTTADDITMGAYTPAGTVAVTAGTDADATVDSTGKFTPAGTVTLAQDEANGYQVTGSVAAPTISIDAAEGAFVTGFDAVGAMPTLENKTNGTFATEGFKAEYAPTEADAETLVLTQAGTGTAVAGFDWTAGSMPTLATGKAVVKEGTSATATAPAFTGGKIGATFAGGEGNVNVSGTYKKTAVPTATFTGTAATLTATLNKSAKQVTVGVVDAYTPPAPAPQG